MASRMLLCSLLFTLCGAALQLDTTAASSSPSSDDDQPTLSSTSSVISTKGSSTTMTEKAITTKKISTTTSVATTRPHKPTPTKKQTTTKKITTTTSIATTPMVPACNRTWLMDDRCGEWILEFPVFLITRQHWNKSETWPQCDQWAGARWCDIDEFCPPTEVPSYIKGMWLDLSPLPLPAEFIVPCDWMRQRIPRFQNTWQDMPEVNSSEMSEMRKVYYESTVRGFDANMKEDSTEVFTCKDMHGNKYAVTFSTKSLDAPPFWYWTTNNYRELVDHYEEDYPEAELVAQPGSWSPFLRHTASNDTCNVFAGYSVADGNVEITYAARCTCTRNASTCEPLRAHPLDGICPSDGFLMKLNSSGFINYVTPPQDEFPAPDGNAFSEMCRAHIQFDRVEDSMDSTMQVSVQFGVDRLPDVDANCEKGFYKERQCVLLTDDCYRNVISTPSKACCKWNRCDPREDPACARVAADAGLMTLIHGYLINPSASGTQMRQELINAVGYCLHHSNERTKGYRDDVPKYCLVFADVHWPTAFVNISLGYNFQASHGEERLFESFINSDNVKHAILIHGTAIKFCNADPVPPDSNGRVDPRRLVAVWKCRTKANPWDFCDKIVTPGDIFGLVEKPLCYVGKMREGDDQSRLKLTKPDPLNVLCYFTRYADEHGNGMWDEYGWFDPHEERFTKRHDMDCFETDGMNCDKKDDVIFCCCRTSAKRGRVCNAPEADLWEQYRVKHQLRDPQGMQTNQKERKKCENPESKSSELQVAKVVAGFIENEMCYLEVNAHTTNDTDIEHEKEHNVRKLYQRPMSDEHPFVEVLCRREYWTTLNWLDGCSCRAFRSDGAWKQYCCCIAREGDSISKAIDNLHERHLLRLNDFTH